MTTDCLPHQATREARAVIEQLLTNTVREAARRAKKLLGLHASAHDGAWTPSLSPQVREAARRAK